MKHPIIEIENLRCGYRSGFHIDDISFTLPKELFAGIIGPNGSGKTTLFRGISGSLPIDKGRVLMDGKNMAKLSLREKAQKLSLVSQFRESTNMSVEEYVLMGRMPYRKQFQFFDTQEDISIAHHYMNLTNTYRLREKQMTELSGGEQQMVSIASALSQKPQLLLLDEPTSHLDITHQMQFMNLIQKLNEELSLSVIMIVHDLSLAAEYCDYIVMMKEGRIYNQGTPEVVFTYEQIEAVYNTAVIVKTNPISGKPVIFPISERKLNEYRSNR